MSSQGLLSNMAIMVVINNQYTDCETDLRKVNPHEEGDSEGKAINKTMLDFWKKNKYNTREEIQIQL